MLHKDHHMPIKQWICPFCKNHVTSVGSYYCKGKDCQNHICLSCEKTHPDLLCPPCRESNEEKGFGLFDDDSYISKDCFILFIHKKNELFHNGTQIGVYLSRQQAKEVGLDMVEDFNKREDKHNKNSPTKPEYYTYWVEESQLFMNNK